MKYNCNIVLKVYTVVELTSFKKSGSKLPSTKKCY